MLKYVSKREHYSYQGMVARTQLAALDNNTNTGHSQAVIKSGERAGEGRYKRDDTSFASQKQIKDGLSNQLMRRNHIRSCQTYFQKCSVVILKTKMGLRS